MTGRITTRAGRKIRHVAPGHVVDVATGQSFKWRSKRGSWGTVVPGGWHDDGYRGASGLDKAIRACHVPAGICALVRGLVEAWQAEHADLMDERTQMEHEAALTASPYR